jgi:uncharacterized protein YecT (DUF1311 family)
MKRLFLFVFLLSAPATAQELNEMDIADLDYCLSEVGGQGPENAQACIGAVVETCQATEGAGSTADCYMREAATWDAIAANRYEALRSRSKPDIAASVTAAQGAWTVFRDAHCDATGAFFYQYSGSASAEWQGQCVRDLAADRAILLDDWATRLEDF